MDGEVTRESVEVPVACSWSALTADQQERQRALYRQLRADVKEVRELDDGYAFGHSPDRTVLLAIAEFVANERLCCPFFEFGLTVERDGGPVWLRMTGAGDAKRVLEAEMGVDASSKRLSPRWGDNHHHRHS
jgi:hypothetical protein